jgi:nicotinic acid phosphoribosyltransferase
MVTSANEVNLELSKEELRYLRECNFIDSSLMEKIKDETLHLLGRIQLKLSASDAEKFGDSLTERLARTGFDQEYKLTVEGEILETLIDKLQPR